MLFYLPLDEEVRKPVVSEIPVFVFLQGKVLKNESGFRYMFNPILINVI